MTMRDFVAELAGATPTREELQARYEATKAYCEKAFGVKLTDEDHDRAGSCSSGKSPASGSITAGRRGHRRCSSSRGASGPACRVSNTTGNYRAAYAS